MKKEEKKSFSCFLDDCYRFENPWEKCKRYVKNIKFAYQRIRYGYCDKDVWSIDWWFLNIMPNMLDDLRKTAHGYPVDLAESCNNVQVLGMDEEQEEKAIAEWDSILSEIAFLFREANEETCLKKNPYKDDWHKAQQEFAKEYGERGEKLRTSEEIEKEKSRNLYTIHTADELPEYQGLNRLYTEAEREIEAYRNECKDKGIDLFKQWFWNLWD